MSGYENSFLEALQAAGMNRPLTELGPCFCRVALLKLEGKWLPFYSKFKFDINGSHQPTRSAIEIGRLRLIEECLPANDVVAWFAKPDIPFSIAGVVCSFATNQWRYTSPQQAWFEWYPEKNPCFHISTDPQSLMGLADQESLIREFQSMLYGYTPISPNGGPSFCNVEDAIDWWMGYPEHFRVKKGRRPVPTINVVVPLGPGQIRSIARSVKQGLIVELVPGVNDQKITVSVAYSHGDEYRWSSVSPDQSQVIFPDIPSGEIVVFTHSEGVVRFQFKGEAEQLPWLDSPTNDKDEIQDLLEGGENDTCEFKLFCDSSGRRYDHESFLENIRKNIAAMANSNGGKILFGIDDDGTVVGVEPGIDRICTLLKCEANQLNDAIVAEIKKHLGLRLSNVPKSDFRWMSMREKSILVISVPRNARGIVTQFDEKTVYVRKGATTRHARPQEILSLFGKPH